MKSLAYFVKYIKLYSSEQDKGLFWHCSGIVLAILEKNGATRSPTFLLT